MLEKMVWPTPGFSEAPIMAIDSGEKKNFEALIVGCCIVFRT